MKNTIIILLIILSLGCSKDKIDTLQGRWIKNDGTTIIDIKYNKFLMYKVGQNVSHIKGHDFYIHKSKIEIDGFPVFKYQLMGNNLRLYQISSNEVLKFKRLK